MAFVFDLGGLLCSFHDSRSREFLMDLWFQRFFGFFTPKVFEIIQCDEHNLFKLVAWVV